MGFGELLVLAVGVSMDAFAVSICKGLAMQKATPGGMAIVGGWFGGFQALMPLLGYIGGRFFTEMITGYAHWIAFILLVFIGGSMIREAFGEEECTDCSMSARSMLVLAVATSIDALAVGVTLAFLKVSILPAVSFIGVVTFVCSALGVKIGSIFGMKYKGKAECCGGIILILIGLKILLEGLGYL